MKKPVEIFCCYAREDRLLLHELRKHLMLLQRQGLITIWAVMEVGPGKDWEHEVKTHLDAAQIILLLVSSDFLGSEYIYSIELERALERHRRGEVRVIPVILRSVSWHGTSFGMLQSLPNGKPVTQWPRGRYGRDEAFSQIATAIEKVAEELLVQPPSSNEASAYREKGWVLAELNRPEEALAAHERYLALCPDDVYVWDHKGRLLAHLKRYQEALAAYEQAINVDPTYIHSYRNKGLLLRKLGRYQEALAAYEQAINVDPTYVLAYNSKGLVLYDLGYLYEALEAFNQAIGIDPGYVYPYNNKNLVLRSLKRYHEALESIQEAIRVDPTYVAAYLNKVLVLDDLGRHSEALEAFSQAIELDPHFGRAYYETSRVLSKLGRSEEAQQAYEKAKELGYMG